jgi:hypothetical protein
MATQKPEGDPELTPSILDIDYTPSHVGERLDFGACEYITTGGELLENRESTQETRRTQQ